MDIRTKKRSTEYKALRHMLLLCMLTVILILMAKGGQSVYAAKKGYLSKKSVSLYQGQMKKLKVKGVSGIVQWRSSNESVASVTEEGRIKALAPGVCRIWASAGAEVYSCKVRVKAFAFTNPISTMVRGRQHHLELTYPKAKNVIWTSSKPNVAAVENGNVQAKVPGTAVITARWRNISVKCSIKVTGILPELLSQAYPAVKQNKGKIMLAGSSSMDFWNNASNVFSPYQVINTAIAGSTVEDWMVWYPLLITRYKPSAVVLYVGSNDIGNGTGISGEKNAANTICLLNKISKKLKKTPVFYISVNPCWSRKGAWGKIKVSNTLVRKYCAKKKYLFYIDIVSAFAKSDGTPDSSLFLSDQLHPSAKGYIIWKKKVANRVKKKLKSFQKNKRK